VFFQRVVQAGKSFLTLNRDREFAVLKRMLELKSTDHLLDSGCGDGFWTVRFSKNCGQVVGVDPGEHAIECARTLHASPKITYVRAVGESLPFADHSFDKIVSVSSLEHFADPLQGLREIARLLKPGGRVALSVDSILPENSEAEFREWHKRRHFVTHYFTQNELFEAMEALGLRCRLEQTVHLFRSRLAGSLRQMFIRRPHYWLPLFPMFYTAVRVADRFSNDMHGQIIIASASR
jgi:SAM-dependent methyltransferase